VAIARVPKDLEYPSYGMNTFLSPELLPQNASQLLVNSFPGSSVKPRHGITEKYSLSKTDGEDYGISTSLYLPEAIGYEKEIDGVLNRFLITWAYRGDLGVNLPHRIIIHNITNQTTQYLDEGIFEGNIPTHASFLKLNKCIYVCIEKNYTTNITNPYRDISKILELDDYGVWNIREIGINVSPLVQNLWSETSTGFGLWDGRSQYGIAEWGGELWVYGGINSNGILNTLFRSPDGNLWTQQSCTAKEVLWTEDNEILTNENGDILYTDATMPYRYGHKMISFNGKLWLIGGRDSTSYYDDIWYTEDGSNWIKYSNVGSGNRYDFQLIEFNNKLWLIGGFDDTGDPKYTINYSLDGFTWVWLHQHTPFAARGNFACCVYDGKVWVHGGGLTSIYNSENMYIWTLVSSDAGLGPRSGHSLLVYNELMWCVAGIDGSTEKNDIYNSSNGIDWNLIQGTADFSARYNCATIVFLDELYILCGYTGSTWPEDAYHSNDGVAWTQNLTGIESDKYYDYTFTFVRRTDEFSILSSISNYIYRAWITSGSTLIVGIDELLLTGVVSVSGTSLSGVDTLFTTELSVGKFIRIDGLSKSFEIVSITDDTNAVITNTTLETITSKEFSLLPSVGDSITTDVFRPGELEGIENIEYRKTIYAYSTTDYSKIFLRLTENTIAQAKGATHIRIYRTLQGSSQVVAQGLSHRYLVDVSLNNNKTYIDDLSDTFLTGVTYSIDVTGLNYPPAGRYCAWAGGRLWIGGNSDRKGYWFASQLPSNTQYPQKYASLFDLENDWVATDPDDGQMDTGCFEFLGDIYFCKTRKIFALSKADLSNDVTQISYHIGVACPNSISFGINPSDGQPAVFFISESGPAKLTAGGEISLLHEFSIAELWPDSIGVINNTDGESDWYSRNKVHGSFFMDTYWVIWGDSQDTISQFAVNNLYGCHHAKDGLSYGPLKIEFNDYTGFEPLFIVPFSNTLSYAVSHKYNNDLWRHRISQFLDFSTWYDTYTVDDGIYSGQSINIEPVSDDLYKTEDVSQWDVYRIIDGVLEASAIDTYTCPYVDSGTSEGSVRNYSFSYDYVVDDDLESGHTLQLKFVPTGYESDYAGEIDFYSEEYNVVEESSLITNVPIHVKWKPRPYFVGNYRNSFATLEKIYPRISFSDDAGLSITAYSDESRHVVPNVFVQKRQSGVSVVGSSSYRKTSVIKLKEGIYGSNFSILIDKTIPLVSGVECPVEIYSPEIEINTIKCEDEFQSPSGALPTITFVENANIIPEVPIT
jgi:hypothetical protein